MGTEQIGWKLTRHVCIAKALVVPMEKNSFDVQTPHWLSVDSMQTDHEIVAPYLLAIQSVSTFIRIDQPLQRFNKYNKSEKKAF